MDSSKGILAALCAYTIWGILPVYWKLLQHFPAYTILCHRMVWSLFVTLGLVFVLKRGKHFLEEVRSRKNLMAYTISALTIAANWFIYIWAVNGGYIIETSFGYYITPLLNVLLGIIVFREKMRMLQLLALLFALTGVLYLTVYYGRFPWISLLLAFTFALYGLLHKLNTLPAIDGLCLETGILFLPALLVLLGISPSAGETGEPISLMNVLLLAGTGFMTTAPLLLFGYAAQNIRLSTLGMLQYLAPTINLFIGIFVYSEEFPFSRFVGFLFIWIALGLYMAEGFLARYRHRSKTLDS